jgi:hypothetical protein
MAGTGNDEEQALFVPISSSDHSSALNEHNHIVPDVGAFKAPIVSVELIKRNEDNPLHLLIRQSSLQNFT